MLAQAVAQVGVLVVCEKRQWKACRVSAGTLNNVASTCIAVRRPVKNLALMVHGLVCYGSNNSGNYC